ncbi:MAG TPA: gamma carbonic anhydrase family protein [Gemmatimonadaceae bacterium]|nr:gamma carbonic anhydrase family protein [Gemmatimonadaceae bacterium]
MSIHPTSYIHPEAFVCGDVTLGERASVWPGAVLRGDRAPIVIGDESNVQDLTVIHVDPGVPATIGNRVGIGHRAIIHGATVGDDCLIGMGAILLNHVRVGEGSVIAAGAVCPEGMEIPAGSVVVGAPARVVRPVDDALRERIRRTVASYLDLQERHRRGEFPRRTTGDD